MRRLMKKDDNPNYVMLGKLNVFELPPSTGFINNCIHTQKQMHVYIYIIHLFICLLYIYIYIYIYVYVFIIDEAAHLLTEFHHQKNSNGVIHSLSSSCNYCSNLFHCLVGGMTSVSEKKIIISPK